MPTLAQDATVADVLTAARRFQATCRALCSTTRLRDGYLITFRDGSQHVRHANRSERRSTGVKTKVIYSLTVADLLAAGVTYDETPLEHPAIQAQERG